MKRPWRALAFLATVVVCALALSTSALAVGGSPSPARPQWRTSLGPATWSGRLTALYPGAQGDAEVFPVKVTDTARAAQRLRSLTAAVPVGSSEDAETAQGAVIPGCLASWFVVTVGLGARALPATITPGGSYGASVRLLMRDSGSNQDACRGAAPAFTVTAG